MTGFFQTAHRHSTFLQPFSRHQVVLIDLLQVWKYNVMFQARLFPQPARPISVHRQLLSQMHIAPLIPQAQKSHFEHKEFVHNFLGRKGTNHKERYSQFGN